MAHAARGFLSALITFISYGILPLGGSTVARSYGIHLQYFDPDLLAELSLIMAVLVFVEKTFEESRPALSGTCGVLKAFLTLWYFLTFLSMIEFISIPAFNIIVHVKYNLIKDLTITSIALYAFKNIYLLIFGGSLKEK